MSRPLDGMMHRWLCVVPCESIFRIPRDRRFGSGGAVGAIAPHIDECPWCGEPDALSRTRAFLEYRFGPSDGQEEAVWRVGMGVPQENDFAEMLTQDEFTKGVKPTPSPPELWDFRRRRLSSDEIKLRRRELGELR